MVGPQDELSSEVEPTGSWDDYRSRTVGTMRLPAGRSTIIIRPESKVQGYLLDLHQIVLYPVD